jgi:hypothetical protein
MSSQHPHHFKSGWTLLSALIVVDYVAFLGVFMGIADD